MLIEDIKTKIQLTPSPYAEKQVNGDFSDILAL